MFTQLDVPADAFCTCTFYCLLIKKKNFPLRGNYFQWKPDFITFSVGQDSEEKNRTKKKKIKFILKTIDGEHTLEYSRSYYFLPWGEIEQMHKNMQKKTTYTSKSEGTYTPIHQTSFFKRVMKSQEPAYKFFYRLFSTSTCMKLIFTCLEIRTT